MSFLELLVLAVGLSMDAFAVSVCKGLATKQVRWTHILCAGAWFGAFQGIMPLLGYLLGARFRVYIERYDHWIAFALLSLIGLNMIREVIFGGNENTENSSFSVKTMFLLAVATSVDALAVGITLALLITGTKAILRSCLFIACITFLISGVGIKIGAVFGSRFEKKAELCGGIILILIGTKILLEHLGLLPF